MGRIAALASLVALSVTLPGPVQSQCRIQIGQARCALPDGDGAKEEKRTGPGSRFVSAPAPPTPRFAPGDVLPDDYMVMLNSRRRGLPAPRDGWTYFRVEREIYRADLHTRVVIERVGH